MFHFGTLIRSSILPVIALIAISNNAQAARGGSGGGDNLFGIVGGVTQSTQDQLNTMSTRANVRSGVGPISTPALNSAWEGGIQYGYRFSGTMFTLLFRPTFFYSNATGSSTPTGQAFNYSVTGMTFFPFLRLIPLENEFMKFFMQFGLGYGRATTKIEEAGSSLTAYGDAFGTALGLGAEFCFNPTHCLSLEANVRYLTMERNIVDDVTGTFASTSLSQAQKNQELELDGDDLKIRMGGLQLLAGYAIHF